MAQWNLSVQLRGQGTSLVTTLNRSARAARDLSSDLAETRREIGRLRTAARQPIRLKLEISSRGLRTQIRTAVREASSGQNATIPLKVNARGLRTSIRTAVRAAGAGNELTVPLRADARGLRTSIRNATRGASGQGLRVSVHLGNPRQLRREVAAAVRGGPRGYTINARVDIDNTAALAQIAALRAALAGINGTVNAGGGASSSAAGMSGMVKVGAIAAAVLAAVTVGAPIAAAVLTSTLPIGFAAVGAAALKSDQDVRDAFGRMKTSMSSSIIKAAQPIKPYLIDGMAQAAREVDKLQAPLSRVFGATGPLIEPLVKGLGNLAGEGLPGFERALQRSGPAMDAFAGALGDIGGGLGDMFDAMTEGNQANLAEAWTRLGEGLRLVLTEFGTMLGELTASEYALESVTEAFELVAGAIKFVSKAAQVLAPALSVILKWYNLIFDALNGGLDALLRAGEGFGLLWDRISGEGAPETAWKNLDLVGQAVASLSQNNTEAQGTTELFANAAKNAQKSLSEEKEAADALRESILALNDVNRSALDAQSAMEAAIDDAAAAARKNAGALEMVNGKLNLNSEAARTHYDALSQVASSTQEAAASTLESTGSWEAARQVYDRGRQQLIQTADAMGLTREQAIALADQILQPMHLTLDGPDEAVADLEMVQAKLRGTKGKTVTVDALTHDGQRALEELGFKIKRTKGKKVEITIPAGTPKAALNAIQRYIDSIRGKTVTITTRHVDVYTRTGTARTARGHGAQLKNADGSITDYYANGGITRQRGGVRHFAGGTENHIAQFAPAGSWRVWAEPETGGEAYIPLAPSKRGRSRHIAEETVRRLGGGPVQWMAEGGLSGFDYRPASFFTPSSIASDSRNRDGTFSIKAFTRNLDKSAKLASAWRRNLATVASRAGQDVSDALAAMGEDGVELTKKMATGSSKYLKAMSADLRALANAGKASLSEFTSQLKGAVKDQATFAANLSRLAGTGYGDLASMLAEQGDEDAATLAAQAVKSRSKASAANTQARAAAKSLSPEQVQHLVAIIAAVSSSKTGIHDVAARTGLGEDDIIATANRSTSQIKSALGSRASRFLTDLAKANKGLAYANGGIREGIYATHGGAVTFAEPSTGGEAFIPLGANKRANATRVLSEVAGRFGLGLTDAQAGQVVVIREQGPLVGQQTWNIGAGNSARETAREIERRDAYQLRRLARGGVGARS